MKKGLTKEEIIQVEDRLKRLKEQSEKSIGEIPQLEDPTSEQKEWALAKLKLSRRDWEANNQ